MEKALFYDYSSAESRARTVNELYEYSKSCRAEADARWETLYSYYNGEHRTAMDIAASCQDAGIPWICAVTNEPYVHVESQIQPELPDFEFIGRDDDMDSEKASQRERIVKYIVEQSHLTDYVPLNERRCIITGTAAWKVYWDGDEVRISPVDARDIYPDPSASRLDECEYITYTSAMHRRRFIREFGRILSRRSIDPVQAASEGLDPMDDSSDSVILMEHWYRDDDGDICMSLVCGRYELLHISKYWRITAEQNKMFPFVIQRRSAQPDSIWGVSELESILTLVDAIDRELSITQLSSAFYGSDIILAEQDAFSEEPEQRPGALWRLKPGAIGKVMRLGGIGNPENRFASVEVLRDMIQETVGNYDVDMGKEPSKIMSSTGLAQLIERAEIRRAPKKTERLNAYRRLYSLIDMTALEFYDEKKVIMIGAGRNEREVFVYEPEAVMAHDADGKTYIPMIDANIIAADALTKSKAFMMSAINTIMGHNITKENFMFVKSLAKLLTLPEFKEINNYLDEYFIESKGKDENDGSGKDQ